MTTRHEQGPDFFFEEIGAVAKPGLRQRYGRDNARENEQASKNVAEKSRKHGRVTNGGKQTNCYYLILLSRDFKRKKE